MGVHQCCCSCCFVLESTVVLSPAEHVSVAATFPALLHLWDSRSPLCSRSAAGSNLRGGRQGPRPPQSPSTNSRNDNNRIITLLKLNTAFSYSYSFYNLPPIDPIYLSPRPPPAINLTLPHPQRNTR